MLNFLQQHPITPYLPYIIVLFCTLAMIFAFIAMLRAKPVHSDTEFRKLSEHLEQQERRMRDELRASREEQNNASRHLREEISHAIGILAKTLVTQTVDLSRQQKEQLDIFSTHLRRSATETNASILAQFEGLRVENSEKLEAMRLTVDEKLQGTLEKRLGETFKLVSERLDKVHQGLGEMQSLATGVGDLKRVLTNVKARGSWGEVQLGALLEQTFTSAQFVKNTTVSPTSNERVEFAIRLPGNDLAQEVLLPIDAKFPIEDYERLQHASEIGDLEQVEAAIKALENRIRLEAKSISNKYINPPYTTDFAILFLPTEGLYAEIIRRPGLADDLQRLYRIVVAGPTTLTAVLNSLQMGFRTLAIQQRSSEVWQVLGAVKTEFSKFGPVLESVKKKLQEASNQIEKVEVRNRAIDRKLKNVESVPSPENKPLLETVDIFENLEP